MSVTSQTNLSITKTKILLKHNFRQFLEYGPGEYLPLSMWGHSGIGKTTLVNQVAKELAEELSAERGRKVTITVRSFQMSAMQPFDLSGYPMIDKDTYPGYQVQRFATPEFLVEAESKAGSGDDYTILFFDEWNRARTEMHNAFMGYIDGRGVNGHKIPKNVFCVAAANPETEDGDYGATTECDDQAILDRLIHINVVPVSQEYFDYLYSNKKCHEAVQAFLTEDSTARLPKNDFVGNTGNIRCTNRGFVDVAKAMKFVATEKNSVIREALIRAVAQGILGNTAGDLFASRFGQCEFLTTPEELIYKGSKDAFAKIKAATGDGKDENRLDQVSKVMDNVLRVINDKARDDFNSTQIKRLERLLDMVPQDIAEKLMTKANFRESEKKAGLQTRMEETLQVTSSSDEELTWR